MAVLITLTALSGAGKSEVFDYVRQKYPQFLAMVSYTSRPKRHDDEGGYIFEDKQFFAEHEDEFIELATFPPLKSIEREDVHYYGKHQSQFDGKDYITIFDEVGMKTLQQSYEEGKLRGYTLLKLFVKCDNALRLSRLNGDLKRYNRDLTRELLSETFYDYVLDNNKTKKELYDQIDEILSILKL
ncbi:MAG: hypothetical protein KC535_01735 [Nanoarchaeota archaeon]|nr:hypothetical protein [Nanoarchaeota archaeon]